MVPAAKLDWGVDDQHAPAKGMRIFLRAEAEALQCLETGELDRLPYLTGLINLAATHYDRLQNEERRLFLNRSSVLLRKIFKASSGDLKEPLSSSAPAAFVVSYPRSGNTVLTQLLAIAFQGQILSNLPGSPVPFSKRCYARDYPFARIIKDHVARDYFSRDRCVFVVRDGRDVLLSLGYMTLKRGKHPFDKKEQLPDLIRWFEEKHPFGGWASHARAVRSLVETENKMLVTYDQAANDYQSFVNVARFLDPAHNLPEDHLKETFSNRDQIFENIQKNPRANETWGIGVEFAEDDLFREWSTNRRGSNWRATLTPEAKKAFHETGATESLIEFGFETDENWWKE